MVLITAIRTTALQYFAGFIRENSQRNRKMKSPMAMNQFKAAKLLAVFAGVA